MFRTYYAQCSNITSFSRLIFFHLFQVAIVRSNYAPSLETQEMVIAG